MNHKYILEEDTIRFPQYIRSVDERKIYENCSTLNELIAAWKNSKINGNGQQIKKSTYTNYCYIANQYIAPYLGHLLIEDINGEMIIAFIEVLHQSGLAKSTIESILVVLQIYLKEGILAGRLKNTILRYCSIHFHKSESRVLNNEDSIRMKEYLLQQNTNFALGILLCRNTGMRIGELCGLKWEDFNFRTRTFCIRRTVSRITNPVEGALPKTIVYIRSPKSATSQREIPIPDYLVAELKKRKGRGDFYFLTGASYCTEPRNIQKRFKTVLKHCAMQDCNFHAMRHGFATACLDQGADVKTVSSILGHASVQTTINIYGHSSLCKKQSCINSIL